MYCLFLKKMNRGSAFFKVVSLIIYIYKKNPKSYTNALCHYSVQARTYKKFYKHTKTKKTITRLHTHDQEIACGHT